MVAFILGSIVATNVANATEAPQEFLAKYCLDCHNTDTTEGDRRFDQLPVIPKSSRELELYQDALDRIQLGDMPPADADQPSDAERIAVAEQLRRMIAKTSSSMAPASDAIMLRRLTAQEYDRTVRTLLGLKPMLKDPTNRFPPDEAVHHFQHLAAEVQLSDFLMSQYVDAAKVYLDEAISLSRRPETYSEPRTWKFEAPFCPTGNRHDGMDRDGKYQHLRKNPHDQGGYLWLSELEKGVPVSGRYRVSVRAAGVGRDYPYPESMVGVPKSDPIRMQIVAGNARMGELDTNNPSDRVLAEFELNDFESGDEPQWYRTTQWIDRGYQPRVAFPNGPLSTKYLRRNLVKRYPKKFAKYIEGFVPPFNDMHPGFGSVNADELIRDFRAKQRRLRAQGKKYAQFGITHSINTRQAWSQFFAEYEGPRIRVYEIEIQGPLPEPNPTPSYRRLFGTVRPNDSNATRLIHRFANAAFRRPVSLDEVQPFVKLYTSQRQDHRDPVDAILTAYQGVLSSPGFLFLTFGPAIETHGTDSSKPQAHVDAYDLASRLSYFLWSAPPDQALLDDAADASLRDPEKLRHHVVRMLADDRSTAFNEQFSRAWLQLDRLGTMLPSQSAHREYFNENLEPAMRGETKRFFMDMIAKNRPITDFIDCDRVFVNAALARLYDMDNGPAGVEIVKVSRQSEARGGVLGMASVLTATANGIETSPILRGVWVLETILGTPPASPPPDVEPIEPDTRGATTIRDQLAKHRQIATCNACHQKIDPPGFAMESFDEVGRFREVYRRGERSIPLDASGEIFGERFEDIVELKSLLMKHRDLFAKNLASKLLTYATARLPTVQDRLEINALMQSEATWQIGFQDLIVAVALIDAFLRPNASGQ